MHYEEKWLRSFTPKRYLHGPFAEYMHTMWADMKLMVGPVVYQAAGYRSSAVKLLVGEELKSPDFEKTVTVPREDGLPLHKLTYDTEAYRIEMEACCSTGTRVPTSFVKVTVRNLTHKRVKEQLALLPRTGREDHLVGMEVDGYCHFDANEHNFGFLETNWTYDGSKRMTDGEYEIILGQCEMEPKWQGEDAGLVWYKRKLLLLDLELAAKETKTLTFLMRPVMDAPQEFCYDCERQKVADFWLGELKRIRCVPNSDAHRDVVDNLVVQCLQMFCYPQGKNYVLPRQGGLQRHIWVSEAWEFLVALNRMGDFADYTETAYDTYFDVQTIQEGENAGYLDAANGWASHTSSAILCCADYLVNSKSQAAYEKYADKLYRAFAWIEKTRQSSYHMDCIGKGIFPPMKSTDWPGEFQSWGITDCTNLQGIARLIDAFTLFNDPRTEEIRTAYTDYMAAMKKLLADEVAKNLKEDELLLTNKIGIQLVDPPSGPYFDDGPRDLMLAGVMDHNSKEAHMVETYFRRRGCFRNGLTGLMNDGLIFQGHNADPWAGHTWYTSSCDKAWMRCWLAQGEMEKAEECLEAQMYYGMTSAYYMMERYADNDPYWVPWCPNASANGRLLQMLFDFYGEKQV